MRLRKLDETRFPHKWARYIFVAPPRCLSCLSNEEQDASAFTGQSNSGRMKAHILCRHCKHTYEWPIKYEEGDVEA